MTTQEMESSNRLGILEGQIEKHVLDIVALERTDTETYKKGIKFFYDTFHEPEIRSAFEQTLSWARAVVDAERRNMLN